MIVRRAVGADFFIVTDATGRVCAQGSRVLCERAAAGLPIFEPVGLLL